MTAKCHCYNVLSQFNSQATLPCLKTMKDSQEELNVLNLAMPWRVTKLCTLKNRHIGTSSTELGIAESHFEKQSGILSQQFPLVNQSFQSRGFTNNFMGFPLLPTNISESAGKSALHDLSTHQVIIFLQAGSRWQTWRQNSMEIWDSWCSCGKPRLADSLHLEQVRHKDDFYQQWPLHHKNKSSSWLLQSKCLNYLKSVWCVTWCTIFPWCAAPKDVWPCFKRPGWSSPAETVLNCKKIVARQGIFLHKKPQKGLWKVHRTWPPLCSQEN